MHRIFIHLYYFISKNRLISVATALGILIICGFFASKINFEEDAYAPCDHAFAPSHTNITQLYFYIGICLKIVVIMHRIIVDNLINPPLVRNSLKYELLKNYATFYFKQHNINIDFLLLISSLDIQLFLLYIS